MKVSTGSGLAALLASLAAVAAHAEPVALTEAQMDSVAAGGVETTDGFVCPVITTENVLHAKNGGELGIEGYYTVGGPDVTVPVHATNGDGSGRPGGPFSKPGDTDYTAIWPMRPQ
jgi:hypothetical protein